MLVLTVGLRSGFATPLGTPLLSLPPAAFAPPPRVSSFMLRRTVLNVCLLASSARQSQQPAQSSGTESSLTHSSLYNRQLWPGAQQMLAQLAESPQVSPASSRRSSSAGMDAVGAGAAAVAAAHAAVAQATSAANAVSSGLSSLSRRLGALASSCEEGSSLGHAATPLVPLGFGSRSALEALSSPSKQVQHSTRRQCNLCGRGRVSVRKRCSPA